jgi:predicted ATPase
MRFSRLKLTNWRNFKSAEVHLASRAFFVGANASGKSNLIDAFRFLRDVGSDIGGGLAAAVQVRGGVSALRCLQATRNSDVGIEVDVGDDEAPAQWTYELVFNARKGEQPLVKREVVKNLGRILLSRPNDADTADTALLSQTHLQQINQNRTFRDLVEFLGNTRYLHLVPQIVRDPRLANANDDKYGSDFLLRVKQTPERTRTAMLRRLNEGLKLAVPQFDGLDYGDDDQGRPHLYAKYHHWRPHPAGQSEAYFSDGTLRLLGLLWAAGEKESGPLLLEEPELSLHDAVVEQLVPLLWTMQKRSKRQVLATTHSEVLISARGLGADEVHRLETTDNGTRIVTASDDKAVMAMIETGIAVGAAVMPKVKPENIDQLSFFDVLKG